MLFSSFLRFFSGIFCFCFSFTKPSPHIIQCGWLGSKHQLTNNLQSLCNFSIKRFRKKSPLPVHPFQMIDHFCRFRLLDVCQFLLWSFKERDRDRQTGAGRQADRKRWSVSVEYRNVTKMLTRVWGNWFRVNLATMTTIKDVEDLFNLRPLPFMYGWRLMTYQLNVYNT